MERKTIFHDLFIIERVNFIQNGKIIERFFFYCNNIEAFIERVCDMRGKHFTEVRNKVGFDLGKGEIHGF